jgi:hypothetical protein
MKRLQRIYFAAALLAAGFSASAAAQSPLPFDPKHPLEGIVRPDDVDVIFDYLRDAYGAALDGRALPDGEAARARAEAIGEELRLRARVGGVLLLNAIERQLKDFVPERERSLPPPPYPEARI